MLIKVAVLYFSSTSTPVTVIVWCKERNSSFFVCNFCFSLIVVHLSEPCNTYLPVLSGYRKENAEFVKYINFLGFIAFCLMLVKEFLL